MEGDFGDRLVRKAVEALNLVAFLEIDTECFRLVYWFYSPILGVSS